MYVCMYVCMCVCMYVSCNGRILYVFMVCVGYICIVLGINICTYVCVYIGIRYSSSVRARGSIHMKVCMYRQGYNVYVCMYACMYV